VQGVFLAARAILAELKPIGIVSAILFGCVISFFAVIALKCYDRADIFLL
jgi:predicted membrane protein